MTDRADAPPLAEDGAQSDPIDALLGVMESIEGLDPLPPEEPSAPPAPASDGLDDLFDEIAALAPAQPLRAAPADDGLDSLLGEIAAVSAEPEPAPSPPPPPLTDDFDLDSLLDDVATSEPLIGELDAGEALPPMTDEAAVPLTAEPAARRARRKFAMPALPGGRRLGLALGALAALGVSHGLAFALGAWSAAPHGETAAQAAPSEAKPHGEEGEAAQAHAPAPPAQSEAHEAPGPHEPPKGNIGAVRYVGLSGQARIEGRTIFAESEVRSAIEQLEGGLSVLAELDAAEPYLTFTAPIVHHGDWIEVHACNSQDCTRDALALRFNTIEGQAVLCRTRPYVGGARLFYAYGPAGMKEVPGCP